ncbi:bifunctional riboflavin kinase/FAD synthetase [Vampirovibrio chlorellavorus]|uniref:bifunctional riboflavin kinase/FAD synthetase n=1 Tax=Vampirovibrio chlorellavorus TaxID=758823 RepID=UPI0026F1FD35|nr:bifunctional riboflavin kinase/FAD synthetase [Vampirovibrio chlorellavorus]
MQVHRSIDDISLPQSACALGMFDGVHVGHVMVLENALREARLFKVPSVVVSFANHPQFLISKTPTQLLSTLQERLARFEAMGFDHALILDFDDWLKNLSADAFIELILMRHLGVKSVTVGYDHRFGKNRAGDSDLLKRFGQSHGFSVQVIDPVRTETTLPEGGGQIVSSTLIRKLLAYGDVELANTLLGQHYHISGTVEGGLQRGRKLGFPTANLSIEAHRLIPGSGTYAGYATLNGVTYPAVCNIGVCPTFDDPVGKRVEVHLLDYTQADFYGHTLTMRFTHKLRDEQKFPNIQALIAHIQADCQQARQHWTDHLAAVDSSCAKPTPQQLQ